MPRRRLAIALLFDPATSAAIDELRRSVDEPDIDRIPPHITLVPPVDLPSRTDEAAVDRAWGQVTASVAPSGPLTFSLGPGATFAPRTLTIHLAVSGDAPLLGQLREHLAIPPLARTDRWPFVPHVTLRQEATAAEIDRALPRLAQVQIDAVVDRVTLLEHLPRPVGGRAWWRPIAHAPLDGH